MTWLARITIVAVILFLVFAVLFFFGVQYIGWFQVAVAGAVAALFFIVYFARIFMHKDDNVSQASKEIQKCIDWYREESIREAKNRGIQSYGGEELIPIKKTTQKIKVLELNKHFRGTRFFRRDNKQVVIRFCIEDNDIWDCIENPGPDLVANVFHSFNPYMKKEVQPKKDILTIPTKSEAVETTELKKSGEDDGNP